MHELEGKHNLCSVEFCFILWKMALLIQKNRHKENLRSSLMGHLMDVVVEVATTDELHHKEEPLSGLEGGHESCEEATLAPKS